MADPLEKEVQLIQQLLPLFLEHQQFWTNYDAEADVLYVHFERPNLAEDSTINEDEVIVRYQNKQVVGVTILNASKRELIT